LEAEHGGAAFRRSTATRIFSGRYGARTLSSSVYFVPCIEIGDKTFMKKTLNILIFFWWSF
jgi:hypothetical protein